MKTFRQAASIEFGTDACAVPPVSAAERQCHTLLAGVTGARKNILSTFFVGSLVGCWYDYARRRYISSWLAPAHLESPYDSWASPCFGVDALCPRPRVHEFVDSQSMRNHGNAGTPRTPPWFQGMILSIDWCARPPERTGKDYLTIKKTQARCAIHYNLQPAKCIATLASGANDCRWQPFNYFAIWQERKLTALRQSHTCCWWSLDVDC